LISYYWVLPVTLTLLVGTALREESYELTEDNCLERLSIILSLSATIVALGISFCHLTYLSLKS
jgi:predicted house-cleaning noncanonical NTP pyrophosphatase (MazG superfamily)